MFFFFKQRTAYEMRISDWSSDVCSSDLTFGVDPHRIYMGGSSGGAMMTLRYACEVPGRIAGTALVGAQMLTTLAAKYDTSAPPAMMFIDGAEDPSASSDGNAALITLPARAAFWAHGREP